MTTKTKTRRRKRRVPVTDYELDNGLMKPAYCFEPTCHKFLCYEAIGIGIIHHPCHACKRITQISMLPEGVSDEAPEPMAGVRCGKCGRFLYNEALIKGAIKTKCRGCGEWNTLTVSEDETIQAKTTIV